MGLLSKSITGVSAAAGLALFSQAPEFAQQYRQRLGGAVEELKVVVEDFDRDAQNSQMERNQALNEMQKSPTRFTRDRGTSMSRTVDRYENLTEQRQLMETLDPLVRPLIVLRNPDPKLVDDAWKIFEPAVPLTVPAAIYGGIGAFIALLLARMGIGTTRRARRRRNDRMLGVKKDSGKVMRSG